MIQQTSSKLPANVQLHGSKRPANIQHYICWKFAGRLLDRVNIPLILSLQINAHQVRQTFTAAAVATFSELLLQLKVAISEIVQKCQFLNMSKVGKGCKFWRREFFPNRIWSAQHDAVHNSFLTKLWDNAFSL